jgi:hypothetical protein
LAAADMTAVIQSRHRGRYVSLGVFGSRRFTRLTLLVVLGVTAFVALWTHPGDSALWPVVISLGLLCAGAIAVTFRPADSLATSAATSAGIAMPASVFVILITEPTIAEVSRPPWLLSAITIIVIVLCLRGRFAIAWMSFGAVYILLIGYSLFVHVEMPSVSLLLLLPCRVLIGTAFAIVLRRSLDAVEALNDEEAREIARLSAARAAREERIARLADLEATVRPMLIRIADGETLSSEDKQTCAVLEGQLRDQIQAAALANPSVAGYARAARRRGVDLVMIDEGGLSGASGDVLRRVTKHVNEALHSADTGLLRIRILPPGRSSLISIYRSDDGYGSIRTDLDVHGDPTSGHSA